MRALIRNANDSLALRFSAGVLLSLALAMAVFYAVMHPSPNEFGLMAAFLSVTAVISAGAGYTAYRLGWLDHAPSLRWGVLGGYGLSSLLTFLNVWLTARLMFANTHDLQLATILLLFAGGIGLALGGFLSSALAARLQRLEQAAGRLAAGELSTRVEIPGRDEIARLGQAFNQMAAELQEAQTRQRELDALRRDLIAWVSHDLQTPLASVRAVVEALADGVVEDPATTQRYLETAQKDIRALSRLIDDLFQMAQLDAGGFTLNCEAGSLADLVSDTLESFGALAQRQGVRLNGSVPPEADPLWMDTPRIGRVLANLAANALRHTPTGGQVEIAAGVEGGAVVVRVCDSGEGIAAEDLPRLFERFYRGEKSRSPLTGGAGLGLAIARGIVEAHGGWIGAENRPGGGACFWFRLPRGAVSPPPLTPAQPAPSLPAPEG